jgi:hypothetical protein
MNPQNTAFWQVVHDCLTEFHRLSPSAAKRKIREFRLKLADLRECIQVDLILHQEPFYLAPQLAGREPLEPTRTLAARYQQMLMDRTHEATALGTDEEVAGSARQRRAA